MQVSSAVMDLPNLHNYPTATFGNCHFRQLPLLAFQTLSNTIQTFSRHFRHYPDTLDTVQTLSKHFRHCPDTSYTVQTLQTWSIVVASSFTVDSVCLQSPRFACLYVEIIADKMRHARRLLTLSNL